MSGYGPLHAGLQHLVSIELAVRPRPFELAEQCQSLCDGRLEGPTTQLPQFSAQRAAHLEMALHAGHLDLLVVVSGLGPGEREAGLLVIDKKALADEFLQGRIADGVAERFDVVDYH